MNLWPFKPSRIPAVIARVEQSALTLAQFRSNQSLIAMASKVITSEPMRTMLCVLKNENPSGWVFPSIGTSVEDRALQQARIEGYSMALRNLEAMATFELENKPLEPRFETDEHDPKLD